MTNTTEYYNTLPIGSRLQDYEIQDILGVGGFGITYLAKDIQLDYQVAIKEYFPNDLAVRDNAHQVQPKSRSDSQNFAWGLERFLQEARILAQFKHPNIIRVLRFFQAHNTAYLVMEYEQGQSFAQALKGGGSATEAELMALLPPLLDALQTLHQANFLHRDIKPSNIYLRDKDKSPVLIDFGSARFDVSSRSRNVTSVVTPGYAPFEQYESDGSRQGAWTDIYALGAVLYRTIVGTRPPEATKRISDTIRGQSDPLKSSVEVGRGRYSEKLLQGIDWSLQVLEQNRPQSVAAWAEVVLGNSSETSDWADQRELQPVLDKPPPTPQLAASQNQSGIMNKILADPSVLRVINWALITIAMSVAGILIGSIIIPDIQIIGSENYLVINWHAPTVFGWTIALIVSGLLAYPMVYQFLSVHNRFSADAVYLFGLMNILYHLGWLLSWLFWVAIFYIYRFQQDLIYNNSTYEMVLITASITLPMIAIFFKYQHGYQNIHFKSFVVFLFKLPFLLPIWVIQAIVENIISSIKWGGKSRSS